MIAPDKCDPNHHTTHVILFSEDPFVCQALSLALHNSDASLRVTATLTSAEELISNPPAQCSLVAVVDFGSGGGISALVSSFSQAGLEIPIVALIKSVDSSSVLEAWDAGAQVVIARTDAVNKIAEAVKSALLGLPAVCTLTREMLARSMRTVTPIKYQLAERERLTVRETEVITLLCSGKSNHEIACALEITESTVKTHLSRVMKKWKLRDRVEIVIRSAYTGLFPLTWPGAPPRIEQTK